ncbi:hypothetical protein DNTS_007003 [Danionella cerebrum]|uniref:Mitochondrial fission factor n=1 Tax=Danionella cerebrum TaxID=2873325 RepID=A0A553RAC7_9TELE|nr:hypothetical protein DNTS_007003 [Danionella translucida]
MASPPGYFGDGPPLRERDSRFTEVISQKMRVPDRLRIGHAPDAPDLSPRPLFSKQASTVWGVPHRETVQSPMRRSYSDHAFGRTPPGTPSHSRPGVYTHSPRSVGHPAVVHTDPSLLRHPATISIPPDLLSPQSFLQTAKQLGHQASQKLLQTLTQKYRSRFGYPEKQPSQAMEAQPEHSKTSASQELWFSPEEEPATAVEIMVLRRQLLKMNRRIAGLERQNAERRQTELLLFSLLVSACLINGWLWIRR